MDLPLLLLVAFVLVAPLALLAMVFVAAVEAAAQGGKQ